MRKARRTEYNRNNIVNATKELFAEKGIEGTIMDEIAVRAECSKSTIYTYFNSKDEIYYYIVYEYMNILKDGIYKCIQENYETEKCYYRICDLLIRFEKEYPLYFECILGHISTDEGDYKRIPILRQVYTVGEEINELVVKFLKRGIEEGCIEERIKLLPIVFLFWAGICSIISISANKEEYFKEKMDMQRNEFMRYCFAMLFNSIKKN